MNIQAEICPCGSGESYQHCCQPLHRGDSLAGSAEALMRSRYSAFAKGEIDYLIKTHHPSARRDNDREVLQTTIKSTLWLKLEIINTALGQATDNSGMVEFIAHFKDSEQRGRMHEVSRFINETGQWFYLKGDIDNSTHHSLDRNDPCWCGSGKKLKKCHQS